MTTHQNKSTSCAALALNLLRLLLALLFALCLAVDACLLGCLVALQPGLVLRARGVALLLLTVQHPLCVGVLKRVCVCVCGGGGGLLCVLGDAKGRNVGERNGGVEEVSTVCSFLCKENCVFNARKVILRCETSTHRLRLQCLLACDSDAFSAHFIGRNVYKDKEY